jgi:hypothetical protein
MADWVFRRPWFPNLRQRRVWDRTFWSETPPVASGNAGRFSTGVKLVGILSIKAGNAGRFSTGVKILRVVILRAGNAGRFSTGAGQLDSITCCEITLTNILLMKADIARIFKILKEDKDSHAYIIRLLNSLDASIRRAPTQSPILSPIKTSTITRADTYNRNNRPKDSE